MNAVEIQKMSMTERLQTMEALWDSLLNSKTKIDSPEWHKSVLDERRKKIEDGNATFISLDQLKNHR